MTAVAHPGVTRERRDIRTRALRDMLAVHLVCHPRSLARLPGEVVAAMLEEIARPTGREGAGSGRACVETPAVVTPAWDSRAG